MGMFESPQYLTGDHGLVEPGEEFQLLNAKHDGQVRTPDGQMRDQVKLQIQRTQDAEPIVCWTSGVAIVNQVKRMESGDLPAEVRLDQVTTGNGRAHLLVPSDLPAAESTSDF